MSSPAGPVSRSHSFPEVELKCSCWKFIASDEVQLEIANTIRDAFDNVGVEAAYHEKDGVHVLVQIKSRAPRGL